MGEWSAGRWVLGWLVGAGLGVEARGVQGEQGGGAGGALPGAPRCARSRAAFLVPFFASPRPQLSPPPAAAQRCSLGPSPHIPCPHVLMALCPLCPRVQMSLYSHAHPSVCPSVPVPHVPVLTYPSPSVSVTSCLCVPLPFSLSPCLCVTSSPILMYPWFAVPVSPCSRVPISLSLVSLCMVPHDPCPVPSSPQAVQPSWSSPCWPLCA